MLMSGMLAEVEIQKVLTSVRIDEWLLQDLFHTKWWLLLGLSILGVVVWWRFIDKRRLPEIILYAVLMMFLMMGIYEYGTELTLWDYPFDILPIFPVITAANLWILPLTYSLVYQHFNTWKGFSRVTILVSALLCLVFEPALAWGGYYRLLNWKYYFNFPVYIAVALFIRWVVVQIFSVSEKAKRHPAKEACN